ncbi:hypothetical protein PoB_002487400 [Plakobranchus ocellatus]|uniref:Uncharacterized protein n=1 Tax=Plakobranchus ocellatus TaxID=259542 RepID=A0AAV3ZSP5_9GAST|nr:hypothetical protein PoB_002487400 [Plakobranchus ocellatus]
MHQNTAFIACSAALECTKNLAENQGLCSTAMHQKLTAQYQGLCSTYFSGSDALDPVRRPPLCPSMHTSQIRFGSAGEEGGSHFCSDHMMTYQPKDIIPANRLHLTSLVNRVNQTEGAKVKEVVRPSDLPTSNWSQYTRVHTKLGVLRGPGVAREFPVRQGYNILTGEETGPAWKCNNQRVSGNRVLHGIRQQLQEESVLF